MNSVNIKDYLSINTQAPKKKGVQNGYSYPTYSYEVLLDNGCDVIIRRTSGTGIQRDLTIIPSENLIFVRDVKKGIDKRVGTETNLNQFFQTYDSSIQDLIKSLKNPYYHCEYVSNFINRISAINGNEIIRMFLSRGINPQIFGSCGSSAEKRLLGFANEQKNTFFKIATHITDNYSDKKDKISIDLLLYALDVAKEVNTNNAIWMLDKILNSNSEFALRAAYSYYGTDSKIQGITDIIKKYNLNFQSYINYLFDDLYAQGIATINSEIISLYDDVLNMQTLMYDGKIRDKYPKHLKETHDKTLLIYNLNLEFFQHKQAVKLHNICKQLEYKDDEYCIVTPEDSSELINEGISLHHCVGSYVNKVNNGETSILFLRRVETPEESLITIEYQNGEIKQVKGLCGRALSDKERKFFDKWVKKFKLIVTGE